MEKSDNKQQTYQSKMFRRWKCQSREGQGSECGGETAVLNGVVGIGLHEKATPEQRAKGWEAVGPREDIWRSVLGGGSSSCRGPEVECAKPIPGTAGNHHEWNASNAEAGDEREQSVDDSQIVKGLLSHCLAFTFPVRDIGNQSRGDSRRGAKIVIGLWSYKNST